MKLKDDKRRLIIKGKEGKDYRTFLRVAQRCRSRRLDVDTHTHSHRDTVTHSHNDGMSVVLYFFASFSSQTQCSHSIISLNSFVLCQL